MGARTETAATERTGTDSGRSIVKVSVGVTALSMARAAEIAREK
jgi:hypothetical protein